MNYLIKISFILLFIIYGRNSFEQGLYFNERYSFCQLGKWLMADGAIEVYNGYIITGNTLDTLENFWRRIGIMKIDKSGNQRWSKDFGDTKADYYTGYPGYLIKSKNNGYYIAGTKAYWNPKSVGVGYLMKFDLNWDTVWTKEYNVNKIEPFDTSTTINQMNICNNGDLILTGGFYEPSIGAKILIIRADSLGNAIWSKSFGNNGLNHSYSVIQTSDGGFAIGGFWYVPGSTVHIGDPIVIKTDSLGNHQWTKNLGGQYKDNKAMICLAPDGNILVGTNYAHSMSGNDPKSKINIVKLDNEGNIIWNKQYGNISFYNYLLNIRSLPNGDIICIGSVYDPSPLAFNMGWILKTNADGDSLWFRGLHLLTGGNSDHYLYDVIPTSDNGYLACGYVFPMQPDTGSQDAWVIKLDSIGCPEPFCDTTVGMMETPYGESDRMVIYPNPVSKWLQVVIKATSCKLRSEATKSRFSETASYLVIYDIYGRKVEEVEVPKGQDRISVDVSGCPEGVYIALIISSQQIIARKKFVVVR